jgi:hypothetical protein
VPCAGRIVASEAMGGAGCDRPVRAARSSRSRSFGRRAGCAARASRPDREDGARAVGNRRRYVPAHLSDFGLGLRRRDRGFPWNARSEGRSPRPMPAHAGGARADARPAGRSRAGAAPAGGRAWRARAALVRAARTDEVGTGALQVRASAGERSRTGRLWRMGGAPAPRAGRHARRLVAGQALIGLSVTQGPRSGVARNIAASVWR